MGQKHLCIQGEVTFGFHSSSTTIHSGTYIVEHILQTNRLETVLLFLNVNHGDENNTLVCHLIVMTLPSLSTLLEQGTVT